MILGLALFVTISLSLALGILAGYATVALVLRLMSFHSQPQAVPALAPQPQASPASGD